MTLFKRFFIMNDHENEAVCFGIYDPKRDEDLFQFWIDWPRWPFSIWWKGKKSRIK